MNYFKLFFTFLKTGTISFGGYMMLIAMIQYEFSERKKILNKKKILDAITMASFLPGPMAINVASYIGFLIKGWKGAVISFVAVLLPSFIIMIIFSHLYLNSRNIPGFSSFFDGVLPVVAAVIFSVAYNIYKESKDKVFCLVCLLNCLVMEKFKKIQDIKEKHLQLDRLILVLLIHIWHLMGYHYINTGKNIPKDILEGVDEMHQGIP